MFNLLEGFDSDKKRRVQLQKWDEERVSVEGEKMRSNLDRNVQIPVNTSTRS